ncbi:oxygen-independent coproporphyrinogen III oxidase [Sabulicella rubraurantiaca]|uniref:oxygen-independent coproporphyrinogen III oxidase n=1 Tax=Sabulicella rubraurantiaca TaxID=2811429 RepID=UPI001A9701F6|nr:oxygen-independent coproporphyrinogen III oxidase [Sabulicella rubraurantiaca]
MDLAAYATASLPRYTSYPTAPHFQPLTPAEHAAGLARIGAGDALSLYLHVPFCHALCWYCGCHTTVTRQEERIERYALGLVREAQLLAEAMPASHGPVTHLHLGGGTPSALGAERLAGVVRHLKRLFPFATGAELSVELDPRTLTEDVVEALAEAGFNRASLGLQDANDKVQRKMGRIQPVQLVEEAMQRLRAAGIRRINLDMMYGLPCQSVAHVVATAQVAARLGADRVAAFGYAHVPWMKPAQRAIRGKELPGAVERLDQAAAAHEALLAHGYEAVGLDHFALPEDPMAIAAREGRLRRNFQGYTTDAAPVLIGMGCSAIGDTPSGYAQNIADERGWVEAVEAGILPVARGLALSEEDRLRRAAIERVMCDLRLDLALLPLCMRARALPGLRALAEDGVVALEGDVVRVTESGRRFLRHVAACFDTRLGTGPGRHSVAV